MTEEDQYPRRVAMPTMTSRPPVNSLLRKSAHTHFLPHIPSMTYQYKIGMMDLNLLPGRSSAAPRGAAFVTA